MLSTALLVLLALGFTHGYQGSTLSKEEMNRYFSVDNEAEAPQYEIVYVEQVNNWRSQGFLTGESIVEASPQFRFQFNGEEVHLTLNQDDSFLAPDFTAIKILSDEGEYWEPIQRDCFYRGYVTKYGSKKSSAQISTCSGIIGAIHIDDHGPLYIEPMTVEDASKRRDTSRGLAHIAYGLSPALSGTDICGTVEADSSSVPLNDDDLEHKDTRATKILYMHIFVDKYLFDKLGTRTAEIMFSIMGGVDYNIRRLGNLRALMGAMSVVTSSNNYVNALDPKTDGVAYLNNVLSWAKTQPGEEDWDLVAVMTGLDICWQTNCNVLGIASSIGGACDRNNRGSINEVRDLNAVTILSHETGHNLGCHHDSVGNYCPKTGYLMGPFYQEQHRYWSTCSQNYYAQKAPSFGCM